MRFSWQRSRGSWSLMLSLLLLATWESGSGQLHYSVPEEAKHGTFVGRIAQDLGLELTELVPRLFRVASKGGGDLLEVNLQNGILFVNGRIDREELCGRSAECSLHLEVIVDRPLQVFHVEVEVKDINDNPPVFPERNKSIIIAESRPPETRFPLDGASDADIGVNSALTYRLDPNDYFALDTPNKREQMSSLSLVLKRTLDREEIEEHSLLLRATDGGKPELTGTVQLLITIADVNDNAPEFDRLIYKVRVLENVFNGTLILKLNATDPDHGTNGDVFYAFRRPISPAVLYAFDINPYSGEIRTKGRLDFEENTFYEIPVEAIDKGNIPMTGHCTLLVEVLDINDNAPEVTITSLSLPVKEDTQPNAVIALISVSDRDSGANGQVTCSLMPRTPFKLVSTFKNYYSLVLDSALDRETTSEYKVVVTARDGGSPPLWATASVSVEVADVNDNAPVFAQAEYTVFVKENNAPGSHIFTVWARDADAQENARVSYSLVERRVGERALSSYVSVHAESGKVYALQPLDHEELELLQFQVSARDAGVPALGSNVTLQVFVLDENDNAPALLGPPGGGGGGGGGGARSEVLWRSVGAGHVVTKVRAVDADSGYNAWLSYELQPAAAGARSPFRVGLYTGEISTTRALDEADAARQRLLVLVKDHGEPALTATATVLVSLVDSGQSPKLSLRASEGAVASEATLVDVNVYLIIAICAVCSLLVLTLVLYVALRCSGAAVGRSEGACAPGKPVLVCSSAVGSLTYSQQRRQKVCSAVVPSNTDLMAFSPSLPPPLGSAEEPCQREGQVERPKEIIQVYIMDEKLSSRVLLHQKAPDPSTFESGYDCPSFPPLSSHLNLRGSSFKKSVSEMPQPTAERLGIQRGNAPQPSVLWGSCFLKPRGRGRSCSRSRLSPPPRAPPRSFTRYAGHDGWGESMGPCIPGSTFCFPSRLALVARAAGGDAKERPEETWFPAPAVHLRSAPLGGTALLRAGRSLSSQTAAQPSVQQTKLAAGWPARGDSPRFRRRIVGGRCLSSPPRSLLSAVACALREPGAWSQVHL
ncbi:protocadherin alpha-13-like [Dipodomys spectabilis]|uniref:protocadherin alpha-13-like n=1 Tax=Dipodomys spectabilis TaxID=105255 RepID=UPI001C5372C5|nr:protocadherin alpha-13-like [Dipodomys spectabilis]